MGKKIFTRCTGFTVVEVIVLVGAVAAFAGVGWYMLNSPSIFNRSANLKKIDSTFNKIKLPGYLTLESKKCEQLDYVDAAPECVYVYQTTESDPQKVFNDFANEFKAEGYILSNNSDHRLPLGVSTVQSSYQKLHSNNAPPDQTAVTYAGLKATKGINDFEVILKRGENVAISDYAKSPVVQVEILGGLHH
jgi:hypothetical protein